MKPITICGAEYIGNYTLEIVFNDNKKSIVDFEPFLLTHNHPQYNKYKKLENFKKFKIENGNIVWGKDWDLIFPLFDLYEGRVN